MNNKLFVSSLQWRIDDQELEELFAKYGTVVTARVIKDRETGMSRGFGFVTMSTDQEAQEAIARLDGTNYNGRKLIVKIAIPQRPREEVSR